MSTPVTLNAIAIDVLGQYAEATKNLVSAYGTASQRTIDAASHGFERLLRGRALPLSGEVKVGIIDREERLARFLTKVITQTTKRVNGGLDQISDRVVGGMQEYGRQTAWAKDLMVVEAFRGLNLPSARASQQIAGRVADASRLLCERVGGNATAVKAPKPAVKRSAKRTRRSPR